MDASGGAGKIGGAPPHQHQETPRIAYVYSVPLIHRIGKCPRSGDGMSNATYQSIYIHMDVCRVDPSCLSHYHSMIEPFDLPFFGRKHSSIYLT